MNDRPPIVNAARAGERSSPLGSFRSRLILLMSVLVFGTAAVVAYADRAMQGSVIGLYSGLVETLGDRIVERTNGYLQPAAIATQLITERVREDRAILDDQKQLRGLLAAVLETYPQLASVYVGEPTGTLYQMRRETRRDGVQMQVWRVITPDGVETRYTPGILGLREVKKNTTYDPRNRPWYRDATPALSWSSPYVFYTSKTHGITASKAILDRSGQFRAVAAADLKMDGLSRFLRGLKIGEGSVMILTDEGEVIAHPDPAAFQTHNGEPRVPALADLADQRTADAFRQRGAQSGQVHRLYAAGEEVFAAFMPFPPGFGNSWTVAYVIPVDDILGDVRTARDSASYIAMAFVAFGIVYAIFLIRHLSAPIHRLATLVDNVTKLKLDNDFSTSSTINEVMAMSDALTSMQSGLRTFGQYVPEDLVRRLIESGEVKRLGGERREVTLLKGELTGYSTIVEVLEPVQVVDLLAEYLDEMQNIVDDHGGAVIEYVGDAIVAVFGAPDPMDDHAAAATRCALAMRTRMERLNVQWKEAGLTAQWEAHRPARIAIRIGVHTDDVVTGNVGSTKYMKYGVLGRAVNFTDRIEQLNKKLGTTILISEQTRIQLPNRLVDDLSDMGGEQLTDDGIEQHVYGIV